MLEANTIKSILYGAALGLMYTYDSGEEKPAYYIVFGMALFFWILRF